MSSDHIAQLTVKELLSIATKFNVAIPGQVRKRKNAIVQYHEIQSCHL
jgi:ribosomal protein L39E